MENTALLLSVCAFSLVCLGLVALIGWFGFRLFGLHFLAIAPWATNTADDEEIAEAKTYRPPRRRASRDLRSRARDFDFDSAVQRHQQNPPPPGMPPPPDFTRGAKPPPLRPQRDARRRSRRDENEDEIFGGILEDD